MIDYKLVKELNDLGFPQVKEEGRLTLNPKMNLDNIKREDLVFAPTLSELINECGNGFELKRSDKYKTPTYWEATTTFGRGTGKSPEQAVAKLWIALNKKQ